MNIQRLVPGCFAVCAIVLSSGLVIAAEKKAAKPVTVRSTGTLDAISTDALEVTLKGQGKVKVIATEKTEIRVKGEFGLNRIQPGMYLTFSGPLTGNAVEGEIQKATMFSLADGFKTGVVKIGDGNPSIAGKVEKIDGQNVTINAGKKITATLSNDIRVNLDSSDKTLVQPGCEVEVRGSMSGKEVKASLVYFWVAKDFASTATKKPVAAPAAAETKPATADAKPAATGDAKPAGDAGKPKVDAGKPKIDEAKPKLDTGKPKVDEGKPKVDAEKPKVEEAKAAAK